MKYHTHIFTYAIVLLTLFLTPTVLLAQQDTFVPLEPLPGVSDATNFQDFLNGAFNLGLAIAGTLAVVMITFGGLQYMSTDSISGKSDGREKVQNAIIGLIIALLIWIILFTIYPNLLNLNFNIKSISREESVSSFERRGTSDSKGGTSLKSSPQR